MMRTTTTIAALALLTVNLCAAADVEASVTYTTHIPSQPLESALETLAKERDFQILYRAELVGHKQTAGAVGELTISQVLDKLLIGTGLAYRFLDKGAVTIVPAAQPLSTPVPPPTSPLLHEPGGVLRAPADTPSAPAGPSRQLRLAQTDPVASVGRAPDAAATADTVRLEEIVVTAQKREERLQDVPMSITALTADTLERTGAMTIQDIGRQVPGLSVASAGPGQNLLVLRGLSSGSGQALVGYYIDDTPISNTGVNISYSAPDPVLFDLNRVEVLRGPQGTLYGASSMGGTVRYITNQPDLTAFHGAAKATFSDTNAGGFNEEVAGLINVPVVSGTAALRLSAFYRDYDGYIDRYPTDPHNYLGVLPGPVDRNVNTERTYGGRLAIEVRPIDSLSLTPSISYQRMELGAPFTFDSPQGSFAQPIQSRLVGEPYLDENLLASLGLQAQVGAVHITSSTSYYSRTNKTTEDDSKVTDFFFDPAVSPKNPPIQSYVYPVPYFNYRSNHNFTEELRATLTAGPVHALVGVYYSRSGIFYYTNLPIPDGYNAAFGTPFGSQPFYLSSISGTLDRQRAVFGELSYDFTPVLQATAGLRYFKTTTDQGSGYRDGVFNGGYVAQSNITTHSTGTTPKFNLSYHFRPDAMVYGTASKGYREGGAVGLPANCESDWRALGLAAAPTSFNPDSIWNYETGAKTQWLDDRLRINGDVYYIKWHDIQQLVSLPTCGLAYTANFGEARSKGVELEMQLEPLRGLHLALGGAYNQAQLTVTQGGAQGNVGDTLENAPKWSGTASADYSRSLGAELSGYAHFDVSSTSRQNNNFDPTSIYHDQPGYSLANLRFGVQYRGWQSSLFVTNLLDKRAESALPYSYAVDLPTTRRISLIRPRTVGINIRFDY